MLARPLPPLLLLPAPAPSAAPGGGRCRGRHRPGRRRPGAASAPAAVPITWSSARCATGRGCSASWSCPACRSRSCSIALGVSAAVCLLLARYLAAPVDRLRWRRASWPSGDLNVRVLPALKGRKDDLGLLAADLDAMAERLRQLLEGKQQLLRDVSHELRSPLARLQLALSLARRDESASRAAPRARSPSRPTGSSSSSLARSRSCAWSARCTELERSSVDVGELLRTIGSEVAIEADAQGCLVRRAEPRRTGRVRRRRAAAQRVRERDP